MSTVMASSMLNAWRLQPIVSASSGSLFGYEMLTHFTDPRRAERYFQRVSDASVMQLFERQQQWMGKQGVPDTRYFCNLPVSVLSSTCTVEQGGELVIELQDPEALAALGKTELRQLKHNLALLRRQSVSLWLDDVTPALLEVVKPLAHFFGGIKIDKSAFWTLAQQPLLLQRFVERCRQLCPLVLIEGVETSAQRQLATRAGADYLQGFLWPEIKTRNVSDRQNEMA